jgi:hypothetical protein
MLAGPAVPHVTSPRLLHVANGTSTTRTIEAAGIPGTLSIWADPLYEGPVPGGLSDAELMEVRRRFLSPDGRAASDPLNDLRRWRHVIERHDAYDDLILWFEHDLFDQLNLIQLLSWIRDRLPREKRVGLICIGSFPGRPDFKGLGELTPRELAPLVDTRRPVTDAQYALAARAWDAFRQPTPDALDGLRRDDTSALPYLAAAIQRFLQEYPWTTDGLSRTERRLLALADAGIDLRDAFPRMQDGEAAYSVTDGTLMDLARTLSTNDPALLTFSAGDSASGHVVHGAVTLTSVGRAVLGGERDRIAIGGLDRWMGGVHLQVPRGGESWRWDADRARITRR